MEENYDPYGQPFGVTTPATDLPEEGAKDGEKDKDKLGGRPAQTLMRVQYPMHMDLSALADSKANIMISINGLIVSILLGTISSKIETNPWLLLPTTLLLVGCLISLVFAILAAMPRVTKGHITLDEARRSDVNLLFFGNFARLSKSDYVEGMTELIQDKKRLYRGMIEDIYGLGSVLQRKFNLLRISYAVFMVGLISGALLYIVVFIFITRVTPV